MSFPRYEVYKDSGVEWLGDVPAHWEVERFDLVTITHKNTITPEGLQDRMVLHYSIPQIQEFSIPLSEQGNGIDSNKLIVTEEQLLVSKLNPHKQTIIVAQTDNEYLTVASTEFVPLIAKGCDLRYITYVWNSGVALNYLLSRCESATRSHQRVNPDDIAKAFWAWPSKPEQRAISYFLAQETAKIDALIEEQQRLIALLKETRQAVFAHAIAQFASRSEEVHSSGMAWLGDVSKTWEIKPLYTVCRFQPGAAHEPYVDEDGEFVLVNSRFVSTDGTSRKYCNRNYTPAVQGDSLIVMSDLPNGRALAKAYFVTDETSLAVNQRVCIISPTHVHAKYAYYFLDRNPELLSFDDGVNQTHLSNDSFKKLPFLLPSAQEQAKIANHIDAKVTMMECLRKDAVACIELLQERRAALISAAVTGKIDVRNYVPREAVAAGEAL